MRVCVEGSATPVLNTARTAADIEVWFDELVVAASPSATEQLPYLGCR